MSQDDRAYWDERFTAENIGPGKETGPPEVFAPYQEFFATEGEALELACGSGGSAVWLARRGMRVWGVDVSPVAIDLGVQLAQRTGVADRCRFEVFDLDDGLPDGPPVDVLLCHKFRDPRLYRAMVERLAPGGLLAVGVLSEIGAAPGRFRATPGELDDAFRSLEILARGEDEGMAWVLARRAE